jgi:hypothetical protein
MSEEARTGCNASTDKWLGYGKACGKARRWCYLRKLHITPHQNGLTLGKVSMLKNMSGRISQKSIKKQKMMD